MSKNLFQHIPDSCNYAISLEVPSEWDYWTENGERVNFLFKKIQRKIKPGKYVGYTLIIWIFNFKIVWRK